MFRNACLEMLEWRSFLGRDTFSSNIFSFERELLRHWVHSMSCLALLLRLLDILCADGHVTCSIWYVVNLGVHFLSA